MSGVAGHRGVRSLGAHGRRTVAPDGLAALATLRATGVVVEKSLADVDPLVAAAVRLAQEDGVPLGPVLDAATDAAEQDRRLAAEVEAAVAPARAVARSLVALPLVAVPVLGTIAGIDLVGFYLHDPVGRVLGVVVVVLVAVAVAWMRLLLATSASAQPSSPTARRWTALTVATAGVVVGAVVGLPVGVVLVLAGLWRLRPPPEQGPSPAVAAVADLAAVGLVAGYGLPTALRHAADHLATVVSHPDVDLVTTSVRALAMDLVLRPGHDGTDDIDAPIAPLAEVARALATTGAPGTDALRALARRLRDDRARRARSAAARLPARLTFPTALVLVPATVLAIGAPIVLQGLAGLTGT